jgi:hypothetical protein
MSKIAGLVIVPEDHTVIEIPLPDGAVANLKRLVEDYPSVYGEDVADVAAYLIQRGLDDLARAGMLVPLPQDIELDDTAFGAAVGKALGRRREAVV